MNPSSLFFVRLPAVSGVFGLDNVIWSFYMDFSSHKALFSAAPDKPSYAMAVSQSTILPISDESATTDKGGYIAIKINQQIYEQRLAMCENALIARLILSKGESPWKLVELKKKISTVWGLTTNWKLISLGRGFYHIILTSKVEKNVVWSRGAISLKPGILRLQHWTLDFDPADKKSTNTQFWVRLCMLPWNIGIRKF